MCCGTISSYLGITITDDLDCGQHINNVTRKATKTLGFLRYTTDRSKAMVTMLFLFCSLHYEALHVWSCPALCLCVSSVHLAFWSPCFGKRELVFVLIVHLFVSYAHVNLHHFFSSSWCQGLAATSAFGSSWTILFTFFLRRNLTLTPKETKVAAYQALVRPQLEYAAPIWNPHHQTEINREGSGSGSGSG